MVSRRTILTGLLLSLAANALADCSIGGTTTVQSEADATALASCTTFSGSIAIATHFAGDISLDNIKEITGTLIAQNVTGLTGLSGDSLEEIDTFHLEDLLLLNTLNFPHLISVDTISWSILNDLSFLSFMDGISKAKDVNIQYTFLNSLEGLAFKEVDTLSISHNNWLQNVEMPLTRVTKDLYLYANSNKLAAVFDDLQWAYNVTITNAGTISLPSLTSVNGSVGFYGTNVDELILENLETIGGALAISSNPDLTEVSLPALRSVCGGFFINHNPQLQELHLDALTSICGALQVSGNLSSVSFNSLNDVGGKFSLTSSQDGLDCSPFDALHEDAWSNKDYVCVGGCTYLGDSDTCGISVGDSTSSSSAPASTFESTSASASSSSSAILSALSTATSILVSGPATASAASGSSSSSTFASASTTATTQESSTGENSRKPSVSLGMATFSTLVLIGLS